MTLAVRFSDQSRAELDEIWDYVAEDSIGAADQMIDKIIAACLAFTHTPEMGRSREALRPGLRSFPVGSYLIFYCVRPHRIDILRILHGARNLEELLSLDSLETFSGE